jgi:anti-sigma factor RsiW
MNCRDLSSFLQDYFAGELPTEVTTEFASHLGGCTNCTVFLEQYRQTIMAGRSCAAEEELSEAPEELVRAILAAMRAAE